MYFKYKDIKMYYEKHGNKGKNIVILPGFGNTRKTFYKIINKLKQDNTIYIVDFPGFGNTLFPNHDLSIYDYANMINNFLDYLKLDNQTIIGHSFGGRIILIILSLIDKNKNGNFILVDSAGIKSKKTKIEKLKQLIYKTKVKIIKLLPKEIRNKILNRMFKKYASTDYQTLPIYMRNTFKNIVNEDLSNYLPLIKKKLYIIWGENDIDTPLHHAFTINNNTDSILYIIENASHYSYIDNEEKFINIINTIIKRT